MGGLSHLQRIFPLYVAEAHKLRPKYASQIKIIIGLETEFITQLDIEHIERILNEYGDKIEHLVGSVHHVNSIAIDFDEATWLESVRSFEHSDDRTCTGMLLRIELE